MKRADLATWRKAIADLRVMAPLLYPVTVRRVPMHEDDYGWADLRDGRFQIRVNRDAGAHHSLLILSHEWAHCMVWPLYRERDAHHTDHFGIAWAEAYRIVFPSNQ